MNATLQTHENLNSVLFQSFYKDVWRKLIPPGLTEAEADFIADVATLSSDSQVLDIMCGYGRHSIALAKKGIRVTAVDNLEDYIQEINQVAKRDNLPIDAHIADVGFEKFKEIYDAVICMGNCFSSFDRPRALNVLQNLSESVKPGGVFIINSWMIAEIAIKHFEAKTWLNVDEFKYLLDNQYLFSPTRIETDHILVRDDNQVQVLKGVDYIFTFAELETMLNQCGFAMPAVYSTPRKKKYIFGDNKAYIVAVKQ